MAKIMSAECTVCGKIFKGEDCVQEAEAHERIPIEEPTYEIGDILLHSEDSSSYSIYVVERIGFSQNNHRVTYNGLYNWVDAFKLPVIEHDGIREMHKTDLLNNPACEGLRKRLLEVSINNIISRISRDKERCKIDKVIGYEK